MIVSVAQIQSIFLVRAEKNDKRHLIRRQKGTIRIDLFFHELRQVKLSDSALLEVFGTIVEENA